LKVDGQVQRVQILQVEQIRRKDRAASGLAFKRCRNHNCPALVNPFMQRFANALIFP
jgi:hypothetical protein